MPIVKKLKFILLEFITMYISWLFPVIFLYTQNAKEVKFIETLEPVVIFLLCSSMGFVVGFVIFRELKTATIYSMLNGLFLANLGLILSGIQRVFPSIRYWHLIYILIILCVVICSIVKKKCLTKEIQVVGILVFGGLIIVNLITASPIIIQRIIDSTNVKEINVQKGNIITSEKRNIYYLLCDEYASFTQLKDDYQFDNTQFMESLVNMGFNVSENSYNYYSATDIVMANMMQLNYVADYNSTSIELENLTKNGKVQEILLENGYSLQGIGNTEWLGIRGTIQSTAEAQTADGTSFKEMVLNNSFLGIFFEKNYAAEALAIVGTFDELNCMEIIPNNSCFTFFYISAPHPPYYLDSNGNMNGTEKWANDDKGTNNDAYIGMVKYVNSRIIPAISRIIEHDPDSIIILCSDHGSRFGAVTEGLKTKIQNNVYYSGVQIDEIKGMSGINTLRYIFNKEFEMSLEYIEHPEGK